jgi:protein-disulfide isomerase
MNESDKTESATRREAARQAAQQNLKKTQRKQAVRKALVQGAVASVAVLALSGAALFISNLDFPEDQGTAAGPNNMMSGGVVLEENMQVRTTGSYSSDEEPTQTQALSDNVPHVAIFVDYTCPACKGFEEFYGDYLTEVTSAGEITLEYQIISFRDNATGGTRYSSRAGNAAVCVADQAPTAFVEYHNALFRNQPTGVAKSDLSNAELIQLAVMSGVENAEALTSCIENEEFVPWIKVKTDRVLEEGPLPVENASLQTIKGTPTILINGQEYTGTTMEALEAAIAAAK